MLVHWLKSALGRPDPMPAPKPDSPFYAIGDVHGCFDQLRALLDRMDPDLPIVLVGDLVDRGDHSAEVLRLVQSRPGVVSLMGNHERMLLDFLDNPEGEGPRWLRVGGLQTLASFGIAGAGNLGDPAALRAARDTLAEMLGPELTAWIAARPLTWQSGNVAVVHAAADPKLPMEDQKPETLIWGHPAFERRQRTDGLWVVHGHTIVDTPSAEAGRISIDTGAFATGNLTAAYIAPEQIEFLTA